MVHSLSRAARQHDVHRANIYIFAMSYSVDFLVISIVLMIQYRRNSDQKLVFSSVIARQLLKAGSYYIIPSLMVVIFSQTDKIMLKLMIPSAPAICSTAGMMQPRAAKRSPTSINSRRKTPKRMLPCMRIGQRASQYILTATAIRRTLQMKQ